MFKHKIKQLSPVAKLPSHWRPDPLPERLSCWVYNAGSQFC